MITIFLDNMRGVEKDVAPSPCPEERSDNPPAERPTIRIYHSFCHYL